MYNNTGVHMYINVPHDKPSPTSAKTTGNIVTSRTQKDTTLTAIGAKVRRTQKSTICCFYA